MSFEQERQDIETRFATLWTETPIKWSNVHFETDALDEFVSLTIVNNDSMLAVHGNVLNMYRYYDLLSIQIFVRPNVGSRRAYSLADDISNIWRTGSVDFIHFFSPSLIEMGVVEGWFQLNLIIPFIRNEYKTISSL